MSVRINNSTFSEKIIRAIATTFLICWALTTFYPLFFGLNAALKLDGKSFMSDPVSLVPFKSMAWKNFLLAFDRISYNGISFFEMVFNALFFAVVPNVITLFFTSAVSYIVCKYNKYRVMKWVYTLILVVQFIPLYGTLPATYKLYSALQFINSRKIVITSFGLNMTYFLYIYSFFKGVSWDYAESGFIDGAGHWRVFSQLMLPQILPSLSVLFVLSFIASWNDFQQCLLFYSDGLPTLSYGIYVFYNKSVYAACQPVYMAACLLASIPSFILFICFQDMFTTSLTIGGLKG